MKEKVHIRFVHESFSIPNAWCLNSTYHCTKSCFHLFGSKFKYRIDLNNEFQIHNIMNIYFGYTSIMMYFSHQMQVNFDLLMLFYRSAFTLCTSVYKINFCTNQSWINNDRMWRENHHIWRENINWPPIFYKWYNYLLYHAMPPSKYIWTFLPLP